MAAGRLAAGRMMTRPGCRCFEIVDQAGEGYLALIFVAVIARR
jgi:hypothetical protein